MSLAALYLRLTNSLSDEQLERVCECSSLVPSMEHDERNYSARLPALPTRVSAQELAMDTKETQFNEVSDTLSDKQQTAHRLDYGSQELQYMTHTVRAVLTLRSSADRKGERNFRRRRIFKITLASRSTARRNYAIGVWIIQHLLTSSKSKLGNFDGKILMQNNL